MSSRKIKLSILLFMLIAAFNSYALEVGSQAPFLRKIRILNGEKKNFYFESNEEILPAITVIYFWSTWGSSGYHLLDFVDKMSQKYKAVGVNIIGVTKERKDIVKRFLTRVKNLSINLCQDPTGQNYNAYMTGTKGTPYFFVIKGRELLWKGEPFELDRVLSSLAAGNFDAELQSKIEKHRKEMRVASEFMNSKGMLREAEAILKIDPHDITALNFIIDRLIQENRYTEAFKELNKSRKETKKSNIFFLKDSFYTEFNIIRTMSGQSSRNLTAKMLVNFFEEFKNKPIYLSEMLETLIRELPYYQLPVKEMKRISDHTLKHDKSNYAVLSTSATVYYLASEIKTAVALQNIAVKLADKSDIDNARTLLNFYVSIRDINK